MAALHWTTWTSADQTSPEAVRSTTSPWSRSPVGETCATGAGASGPSGSNGKGSWATMFSPSLVIATMQPSPVRQSTCSVPLQSSEMRALARILNVTAPDASAWP